MIESLHVSDAATYGATPEIMDGLSQLNFIYGANGAGKTTVSRVIAKHSEYPNCKINWRGNRDLQTLVYNQDFVEKNFIQSAELKGVFTLGEENATTLAKLEAFRLERDKLEEKLKKLNENLDGVPDSNGGKNGESNALEDKIRDKCWSQKQKHDLKFQQAFEGVRGTKEKFKNKVIHEYATNNALIQSLTELEKKAQTVFGTTAPMVPTIPNVQAEDALSHESNSVLKKRVLGKDDVDIAGMIKTLGNSDWVREGLPFFDANQKLCPFCQQTVADSFSATLTEYFDESFITDTKAIEDLTKTYVSDTKALEKQIQEIIDAACMHLDLKIFEINFKFMRSIITNNIKQLANKKKEPSQIVELESLKNAVKAITDQILIANTRITEHNTIVKNIAQERVTLTAQVWKYLVETELKADLKSYTTDKDGIDKAISAITTQITKIKADVLSKTAEIKAIEKQITSIQPTVDGINNLLKSFGFDGFSLSTAAKSATYKLLRADGSDAKTTLSEGEKTFVTFLYFYHLLKGSESDSGMTVDRVIVFDDPVSSLDSDILFIVGSLIKGLFEETQLNSGKIKQIFILTHNVYFHKEITYNWKRKNGHAMKEETFWIIRKVGGESEFQKYTTNPIKTSYELLWSEIRTTNRSSRSNLTIQNTLRRIMENYFKLLGGIDFDGICTKFEGVERMACKSLFSWVNDGSHWAHDDVFVTISDSMVEMYLDVFKSIFEKLGHSAHYQMMMGDTPGPKAKDD